MPVYAPPDGGLAPGFSSYNGEQMLAYPMTDSGPMPAYPMSDSGPMPTAYPTTSSGPMQAFPPTAVAAPPAPMIPAANGWAPPARQPSGGKRVMGWMPFGQRLVLLPKPLEYDPGEELREHRDISGGWLRPAVFGAMDGLVTNSSLIAGVGAGGAHAAIVITGIAGLIAGAFSMATGEYISVKSQNELTEAEIELERKQHLRDPEGKRQRLTEIYVKDKGVSPNLAEAVVRQISADPDRAVATHAREDLGLDPDDMPSPQTAAIASFTAFTVGALIPLSPFLAGYQSLEGALVISGAAAMAGGAALAKLTGRSMFLGGLRQFTAAALATGMAFFVGHLIGGHVSA